MYMYLEKILYLDIIVLYIIKIIILYIFGGLDKNFFTFQFLAHYFNFM